MYQMLGLNLLLLLAQNRLAEFHTVSNCQKSLQLKFLFGGISVDAFFDTEQ